MFAVIVLRVKTKFLKKGLKIREISRKKVFDRNIFLDGNFKKCPNPCKRLQKDAGPPIQAFTALPSVYSK